MMLVTVTIENCSFRSTMDPKNVGLNEMDNWICFSNSSFLTQVMFFQMTKTKFHHVRMSKKNGIFLNF